MDPAPDPAAIQHALNIGTMLGILILAIPVVFTDARKRMAAKTDEDAQAAIGDQAQALANAAGARAAHWATRWRSIDRVCLYVGYAFLLGSAVLRVVLM